MKNIQRSGEGYNSLKSIGLVTNCFINDRVGDVVSFEDYIVVKTPSNPEYHWGNYIIFKNPPQAGDYNNWCNIFDYHFGSTPEIKHKAFTWDNVEGDAGVVGPFVEDGFEVDKTVILTAEAINKPGRSNKYLKVQPLSKEEEWDAIFKAKLSLKPEGMDPDEYEAFERKLTDAYKAMVQDGLGIWFAGYLGKDLVCDLGIFWSNGIGRFQSVFTMPSSRRQGLCSALVAETSEYALKELGLKTLVIEVDEDYIAAGIYESVGFKKTEKLVGVCKWW